MSRSTLPPRYFLGIFLWACATLLLELALTRILSVALWYHFGFLVISTALLGFGIAGTLLSVSPWLRDRVPLDRALTILAAAFAFLTLASFWLMQRIPFDPFIALSDWRQFILGPLYYAVLSLPFVAAGLGLALLFTRASEQAAQLYAFDLTGAGLGCVLLLFILPSVGGSGTVLVAVALGLCAAAAFAHASYRRVAASLLLLACGSAAVSPFGDTLLPITITPLKRRPAISPLETHWNTTSRVEVFQLRPPALGGGTVRRFVIDGGTAATGIQDLSGGVNQYLRKHTDETEYLSGIAYVGKRKPKILIIGSGGGSEVLDGLFFGASEITAVEVNPTIVDLVSHRMTDYWGGLFQQPEVRLIEDEGRSFLRRSKDTYDAIISVHTISNAAVMSGAMSLTENYVLTKEAFEEYLDHLGPDGTIFFSRPEPHMPRLMATAREALLARGVTDATRHFYLFRAVPDAGELRMFGEDRKAFEADIIIKKSPLTNSEITSIERLVRIGLPLRSDRDTARETIYTPLAPDKSPHFSEIANTPDLPRLYRSQARELAPATDDRPFFNHLTRWSGIGADALKELSGVNRVGNFMLGDRPVAEVSLLMLLAQAIVVAGVCILLPLTRLRSNTSVTVHWRPLVYFSALGFGFITIEMALISRLALYLGQPAYTIALVLGSLLIFSGMGSACAARVTSTKGLRFVMSALLLVTLLISFGMPFVLHQTLGLSFPLRLLVSLCMLAPLGILLGMPFPLGLRFIANRAPELVPWAWGVNGFFTVIGTVTSLMIAMTFGFTVALAVGTGCYLVAAAIASRETVAAVKTGTI